MVRLRFLALLSLFALVPMPSANAAAHKATPKQMEQYEKTTKEVFQKLVSSMAPVKDVNWDKLELKIVDFCVLKKGKTAHNACAYMTSENGYHPVVEITRGYIEAIEGDEHGLALVLGHELGHHFHGHCVREEEFKTEIKATADGHRREADADNFGAKLLLKAGYSLRDAVRAKYKMMKNLEFLYSSSEASWSTHPGTVDRIARLAKMIDDSEETLWRSMAAFENGVYFLSIEDYTAAEACFERVVREFPNCAEAWANLGMARLHRYCDTLSAEDLAKLDIGQFVAGVRFRYAQGFRDDKMKKWKPAETALLKALELKPKSATVLVGLGLAYLVCPERTDKRMQQADKYLADAYEIAQSGTSDLEPEAVAALLINRGVVRLATGETADGQKLMDKAGTVGKRLTGADAAEVESAVLFNTAIAYRAQGHNAEASEALKQYLLSVPSSSPWWKVAYQAYVDIQKNLGKKPQPESALAVKKSPVRKQLAVKLSNGQLVHVGEAIKDVREKLGAPATETTDSGSGLRSLQYSAYGITIIADDEEVFGFLLTGGNAPTIVVKEAGTNGKVLGEIRIGMTRKDVADRTGVADWISRNFTHLGRSYPYSPGLGVALVYGKGEQADTVVGILIGSITNTEGDGVVKD